MPMLVIGQAEGERVVIHVVGRMHAGADDFWDGNWLISPVEIAAGNFKADLAPSLRAEELRSFRVGLEVLNMTLQGQATLESMEGELSLTLTVTPSGRLIVTGMATDGPGTQNQLKFGIRDLDQSYLSRIIEDLQDIETSFPVIGTP